MKGQEVAIKIISKLDELYGDVFDQAVVRQAIEEVLYDYTVEDKETSLAVIDNIGDMALLYLATRKTEGLAKSTLQSYGRTIGRFARHIRKNVEDITAMDIRMYIAQRSKENLKNTTLANDTDILRGFFNFLEDEEYINKSPMRKIKTPKVEKRLREALTKEQFETLRTGAKTLRQKALLETLYSTGCRLEEVEQMKKHHIDWQRLQVRVVGKGNKERVVYINATCQVHLRKYLMSRLDESEAVFVTERKPIKFMGKRAIQREINMIAQQSGIDINIYPHLIRHTFATHMLNSGMSLNILQQILGHDDPSTTLVYAELDNQTVESEYRKYS
ncbi:tyrosine-type recombinase/integrase [Tissierella pigra]|uniref:site-specific tyrosine recombinase/integron integrase n=1 Tax=Tissierella pigra TaxID=2607614 RepID=UPI001C128CA8|nr:site-specific tyrosine recombinase/integron integrase [Tissierella pigra]MBU5425024.1 tyrosine-type recombinase/integrase [Tissierella pigra]